MNMLVRGVRSVARIGAVILLTAAGVRADEIKVMTSGAFSAALSELATAFERASGSTLVIGVLGKSRKVDREPVAAVVARGEAEMGFQQISELRPVPGVEVAGPLPPEVQRVTLFSAAAAAGSTNPSGGRVLIAFLSSPAASAAIAKSGMDPVTPWKKDNR